MVRAVIAGGVLAAAAVTLIVAASPGASRVHAGHEPTPPAATPLLAFSAQPAGGGRRQVFVLRTDGTTAQVTHGVQSLAVQDWSPDGTHLLVTETSGGGTEILQLSLATGELTTVWQQAGSVTSARWSADGSHIAFVWNDHPYVVRWDGSDAVDMLPGARTAPPTTVGWAAEGNGLAIAMRYHGESRVVLGSGNVPQAHFPMVCRPGTGVTCFSGADPAWSPGGTVTFACGTGGARGLCTGSALSNGTSHLRLRGDAARDPRLPSWSPVGDSLAFVSDAGVFVLRRRGDPLLVTTSTPSTQPVWSADGRHLAIVVGTRGGTHALEVTGLFGRTLLAIRSPSASLSDIVGRPVWRPR